MTSDSQSLPYLCCGIVTTSFLLQQIGGASKTKDSFLGLAWTFRVTADNLDAVGVDLGGVVELEVDVLDNECPYVIAEAVGIEMSLYEHMSVYHSAASRLYLNCLDATMNAP